MPTVGGIMQDAFLDALHSGPDELRARLRLLHRDRLRNLVDAGLRLSRFAQAELDARDRAGVRQRDGQWCWCDDVPEGQAPHDCTEHIGGRHEHHGAHVHPAGRRSPSPAARRARLKEDPCG